MADENKGSDPVRLLSTVQSVHENAASFLIGLMRSGQTAEHRESEGIKGNERVCECFRDSHGLKGFAFEKHTHTEHSKAVCAAGRLQMERSETHCPTVPACSGLPKTREASGHTQTL